MTFNWKRFTAIEQLLAEETVEHNPVVITFSFSLAQNPSPQWVFENYFPLLMKHPRFQSRLIASGNRFEFELVPGFVESSDIMTHHLQVEPVIDLALPFPERYRIYNERLSEIISTDLDRTRPLWKVFYFPNWSILADADQSNTATVITRIHHSISDGIGLVKYFLSQVIESADKTSDLFIVPERQKEKERKEKKREKEASPSPSTPDKSNPPSSARLNLPQPSVLTRCNVYLSDLSAGASTGIPDPKNTFTRSQIQREKVCAILPPSKFKLSTLKAAASSFGITVNDVILAAVSGATREYLLRHGDNPDKLSKVRGVIPFNGHMLDEYKDTDVSNQLALVPFYLGIEHEDRQERLHACVNAVRKLKLGFRPAVTKALLEVLAWSPRFMRRPIWRHFTKSGSILFTNVPGPRQTVFVGGVEVSSIFFFAPAGGNCGVVTSVFSYGDDLTFGVAGDKERVEDPQLFLQLVADELKELLVMSTQ